MGLRLGENGLWLLCTPQTGVELEWMAPPQSSKWCWPVAGLAAGSLGSSQRESLLLGLPHSMALGFLERIFQADGCF